MYAVMKGNKFVSQKGSQSSYTTSIEYARLYNTLEEARRDCCENERVVQVTLPVIRPMDK